MRPSWERRERSPHWQQFAVFTFRDTDRVEDGLIVLGAEYQLRGWRKSPALRIVAEQRRRRHRSRQ